MPSTCPAVPKDFLHQSGRGSGAPSASDQQIRLLLRLAGRLDEAALEEAFQSLADHDPILGSRFVETGVLEGRWERRDDLRSLRLCPVAEAADPGRIITEFLTDLDAPEAGPHYRAQLVRSGDEDALCLRIDHRLADGAGAKTVAYLLAERYRILRAGGRLPPPAPGFGPRTMAGLTGRPSPVPSGPLDKPAKPSPFHIPRLGWRNEDPTLAQRDLDPDALARLRRRGKACGGTVNDVLLTALVRALQPFSSAPQEPFWIDVSCDLRTRLPPPARDSICNLFGALFPVLRCVPGEPFPAALARAVEAMAAFRSGLTWESALRAEVEFEERMRGWARDFGWPIKLSSRDWTFVILSNVGVLDHRRLDFGRPPVADARLLGTVALGQEFLLCASTFRDRLTLSHGYCASDVDEKVVEGLMDAIVSELRAFADGG